jgi:LemA protein
MRYSFLMRSQARVLLPLAALAVLAGCGVQSIPRADNAVAAAWGEVNNQYQRRADLVPNLVATVKGYASHERETLEAVTNARARATSIQLSANDLTPENVKRFEAAQGQLGGALGRLLAVAEHTRSSRRTRTSVISRSSSRGPRTGSPSRGGAT